MLSGVFHFLLSRFTTFVAMSSLVDSTAHFQGSLLELGLTAVVVTAIKNHRVTTLSQLAFAVGQPGQPLVDGTIDGFLQAALGRPAASQEGCV